LPLKEAVKIKIFVIMYIGPPMMLLHMWAVWGCVLCILTFSEKEEIVRQHIMLLTLCESDAFWPRPSLPPFLILLTRKKDQILWRGFVRVTAFNASSFSSSPNMPTVEIRASPFPANAL
jgi:hypothetical protein